MTIASEIQRLQDAKACIRDSIQNKDVTVPAEATLDEYPWYIAQIKHTDYSCWTPAYWLKATVNLEWYSNNWLCKLYSEITWDWVVTWLFGNLWWMWDSNCDYMDFYFLSKKPWCNYSRTCTTCRISDNHSATKYYVYAHKTNPDCYLINRVYSYSSSWSGNHWCETCSYYRLWIDFSVPCMSCIMNWSWCEKVDWETYINCDNNNPWENYQYLWESVWAIANCRWNLPQWILCTTIESSDHNHYVWAAVFR